MISIKDGVPRAPKRTINLKNISLKESKFIDETGDITKEIIDALPSGTEEINFKIMVEIEDPDEYLDLE